MTLFSHRKGLKKVRTAVQVDSIDNELRNRLWNVLDFYYWKYGRAPNDAIMSDTQSFLNTLWHNYFKKPVDALHWRWSTNHETLRRYYFNCKWYEIYDFIEFTAKNYPDEKKNKYFVKTCNNVLEEELSAYRFVGERITQITSEEEIS